MKNLFLILFLAFFSLQVKAQQVEISGIITTSKGVPIENVSVLEMERNIIVSSDSSGFFKINTEIGKTLKFSCEGYISVSKKIISKKYLVIKLNTVPPPPSGETITIIENSELEEAMDLPMMKMGLAKNRSIHYEIPLSESYTRIEENIFKIVKTTPLSTFSIDVDKAGYSNIRRMINNGQTIPEDAVKIEEMINYFSYNYNEPRGDDPFSIATEIATSPWNSKAKLVRIGIKGKDISKENIPASNLVFLLDVSGSMGQPNKLPLLKASLRVLLDQLREQDKVSIVVYAGAAGLVLEPTSGSNKEKILKAINELNAGGSTAGGEGIQLAYKIAEENFLKNGNNRVILATDGDFNVGESSDRSMENLIVKKRESGVYLTVLGFGMGNYKDSKMETLADKGNGNHAYIDTMQEAQKILGTEFFGTMYTIAKDVKIQVEFNPNKVQAYRLIGYENRLLADEDFNDDSKDAGEIGSGHTVTALYEIIPVGVSSKYIKDVDDLKYTNVSNKHFSDELLTIKFRYKEPDGNKSKLIEETVIDTNLDFENASTDFKFSAAVALFGMQLRKSIFIETMDKKDVISLALSGKGNDVEGYRAEFIRLVKSYHLPLLD